MNSFNVNDEDRAIVRMQLELTEDDVKRDIEILKEWLKKQQHLPQGIQDDSFFESFLLRSKGRVEKAKRHIDMYYTIKTSWPDLYENLQDSRPSKFSIDFFPMLQLTKEKQRIFLLRYHRDSAETFNADLGIKLMLTELEILIKYDCSSGIIIMIDMSNLQLDLLKLLTPSMMQKSATALIDVYSHRISAVCIYKPPTWIQLFLNIMRPFIKNKIFERTKLYNDIDSLLEVIPKEYLPADYGGEQPIVEELAVQWDEIIEINKEYLQEVESLRSEESLRMEECPINTEMFGFDGTFKKLNVD